MENKFSNIKLGILGGGQLARMIALKSHEMGITPYVLNFSNTYCSAAQVTPYSINGKLNSKQSLRKFLNLVDIAIFENEFLDLKILQTVAKETNTSIYPKPQIMRSLQDRLKQKKLFNKFKIPTAPYVTLDSTDQINQISQLFPNGVVLKKRHQGYDGYGTYISKNILKDKKARSFINTQAPLIAEQFIPFKREMAIILARNKKKQIVNFPLVETFQEEARCVWLKGPCYHKQLKTLLKKIKTMMNQIDYTGVMAFEFFDTKDGLLMMNEIAPRVHNSGHYSLDTSGENQFTIHLKAVLNLDLNPISIQKGGFAMLNLLGKKKVALSWVSSLPPGTKLHWYGKDNRPERKMGHLTNLDSSSSKALQKLLKFKRDFLL